MQRTALADASCPVARTLDRVGEWWSILILRDALRGSTRFDEFQKGLGIAPNMLTRRLTALVEAGLLERHQYSQHPPRHEYLLTVAGQGFLPVVMALYDWGERHIPAGTSPTVLIHRKSGKQAESVMVDRRSGKRITAKRFVLVPNPAVPGAP